MYRYTNHVYQMLAVHIGRTMNVRHRITAISLKLNKELQDRQQKCDQERTNSQQARNERQLNSCTKISNRKKLSINLGKKNKKPSYECVDDEQHATTAVINVQKTSLNSLQKLVFNVFIFPTSFTANKR